jgi:cell wall assembly regulator SMI1
MKIIMDRIDAWLRENAPAMYTDLRPGATQEQIRAAEEAMNVAFPEDVKAAYRIHDGHPAGAFLYGVEWLSLERMVGEWKVWKELLDKGTFADFRSDPAPGVRADWWHPCWIPLTYNGSGDHHCLDLAPAPDGQVGQIIMMWHDDAAREVHAVSFIDWLERFADQLDAGAYAYSPDDGVVEAGLL